SWNPNGVIVFAPRALDVLYRVSSAGGTPATLTRLDSSREELGHQYPYFLPDGRHFLYLAICSRPEPEGIRVGSLDSRETKPLVNTHSGGAYAPPGYLLF